MDETIRKNTSENNRTAHLKVGLLPYDLPANRYIEKNREILESLGNVLPVPKPTVLFMNWFRNFVSFRKSRIYDVLIVNWRENCLVRNGKITKAGVLEYFATLVLFRLCCQQLVYVRHNHHPHNLSPQDVARAKKLIDKGQSFADAVVVHSPIAKSEYEDLNSVYYVPHPLYDMSTMKFATEYSEVQPGFIMFGRVEPYKQIEEVILNWNNEIPLIITGPCDNESYKNELQKLASEKPNVTFDFSFQEESNLAAQVRKARGVIIANNASSMLVSGSFFFSLSCGTPVYTLSNPFFDWVNENVSDQFIVTGNTIVELTEQITHLKQHHPDPDKIVSEADKLFSDDIVMQSWASLLDGIGVQGQS